MPSGTATYTSKGKRPPADPAARNNQVAYGRSVVRTTPADRCSRRESWGRSSAVRATSAVPASTATAGAVVDGRFRGRASRGSDWSYRLENHGKRSRSLASKPWTTRGSSTGAVQMSGRSAKRRSIDVNLCSVCVAVSTARFSRTASGDGPDPNRARAAETGPSSRSLRHNASGLRIPLEGPKS